MKIKDARARKIISVLAKLPVREGRLLDIGCAGGELSIAFKETLKAREIFGIDISDSNIRNAILKGITTSKIDVNFEKFPFPDNFFDIVIASEILEHCIVPEHLLSETNRILKPGGYFILTTPNLASYYDRLFLLLGNQPLLLDASFKYPMVGKFEGYSSSKQRLERGVFEGDPGHIRCMTQKATKELVKSLKFSLKKVTAYSWAYASVAPQYKPFVFILDKFFSLIPGFAVGYIYIAYKEI